MCWEISQSEIGNSESSSRSQKETTNRLLSESAPSGQTVHRANGRAWGNGPPRSICKANTTRKLPKRTDTRAESGAPSSKLEQLRLFGVLPQTGSLFTHVRGCKCTNLCTGLFRVHFHNSWTRRTPDVVSRLNPSRMSVYLSIYLFNQVSTCLTDFRTHYCTNTNQIFSSQVI